MFFCPPFCMESKSHFLVYLMDLIWYQSKRSAQMIPHEELYTALCIACRYTSSSGTSALICKWIKLGQNADFFSGNLHNQYLSYGPRKRQSYMSLECSKRRTCINGTMGAAYGKLERLKIKAPWGKSASPLRGLYRIIRDGHIARNYNQLHRYQSHL